MLKSELMAPAAVDDTKQPEQLSAKQDMAAKATTCLQASIAALGPGLLDLQVLHDVAVEDLMQYLGLVNPPWARCGSGAGEGAGEEAQAQEQEGWHLPQRAQRRLACIASCVAAVSCKPPLCWVQARRGRTAHHLSLMSVVTQHMGEGAKCMLVACSTITAAAAGRGELAGCCALHTYIA